MTAAAATSVAHVARSSIARVSFAMPARRGRALSDFDLSVASGRDGRARRPVRRRQDDAGQPAAALHRADRGRASCSTACRLEELTLQACGGSSRWSARTSCCSTTRSPPTSRSAHSATRRPSACARRPRRQPARLHRVAAAGLRHASRPQRQQALGRPAPAPGDRARTTEERADPAPRRGDLGARLRVGALHPGLAAAPDARPHQPRHRAPPVDDRARRPHRRARRGRVVEIGPHAELLGRARPVRAPAHIQFASGDEIMEEAP